jgi:hypothetical protein
MADPPSATSREDEDSLLSRISSLTLGLRMSARRQVVDHISSARSTTAPVAPTVSPAPGPVPVTVSFQTHPGSVSNDANTNERTPSRPPCTMTPLLWPPHVPTLTDPFIRTSSSRTPPWSPPPSPQRTSTPSVDPSAPSTASNLYPRCPLTTGLFSCRFETFGPSSRPRKRPFAPPWMPSLPLTIWTTTLVPALSCPISSLYTAVMMMTDPPILANPLPLTPAASSLPLPRRPPPPPGVMWTNTDPPSPVHWQLSSCPLKLHLREKTTAALARQGHRR